MKADVLKILLEKIQTAKSILIVGHKNPDGDSLCSVLALARLLKINFNKNAVCVYDGNIPDILDNVPMRDCVNYYAHVNLTKKFDLAFVLDYGTKVHIGGALPAVENAKFVVEIDHHKDADLKSDISLSDDKSAAVGEIIFNMIKKLKLKTDDVINELIAISILTDTGFFKYARNGNILRIMAKLVDSGVSIERISNLLDNKPRKTVLTEAAVTSRAEFFYHGKLALAIVDANDYKNLDGRGDIILSLLGQVKGVEYIALLKRQKEKQIGVSLRGKNKSVNDIAVALGGGGHTCAAGAVVYDTLENTKAKVLELFRGIK